MSVRRTDQFQDEADGLDATVHGGKEMDDDTYWSVHLFNNWLCVCDCVRDTWRRKGKREDRWGAISACVEKRLEEFS